ncbi:MAG: S-layer homology domain-containing protein, partial [Oscillospiraceae bacterium]|nr:S-layer homology domain-containing protein [Oscillospiraceae bacterium]
SGVTWSVEGNVGSITQDGMFTSGGTGSSGTITATAGGRTSTVTVGLENVHNDVTPEHWSYPAVEYCYEHSIVSGISNTEFGRDHSIRRGDFVLMLYNALGKPAVTGSSVFSDVAPSDYYAKAITWASANHLVSGVAEGLFGPTDLVTREQAFTILHQTMPLLGLSSPEPDLAVLDRFADRDQIAEYARPHAAALVSQGLASGAGGVLNPRGQLTRAEMAALLYQLLTYDPASQPEIPETPDTPEVPEISETPESPDTPDVPQVDPDAQLILNRTEGTLASAETLQLTAQLSIGEGPVTWRSSDPSVAAVSPEGVVTNVYAGSGEASVTITASCGPLTAKAVIQCSPAGQIGVVTAEPNLRVRSGPSQEDPVISRLNTGSRVVLLDTDTTGWYQVLFSDAAGQAVTGWASADYILLH